MHPQALFPTWNTQPPGLYTTEPSLDLAIEAFMTRLEEGTFAAQWDYLVHQNVLNTPNKLEGIVQQSLQVGSSTIIT